MSDDEGAIDALIDKSMLVVFVDVRGFTKWSESNEVFISLDHFVNGFMSILRHRFPPPSFSVKPLGDGALVISELPEVITKRENVALLSRTLKTISSTEGDFERHCSDFGKLVGHATRLKLGWGIVRGKVIKTGEDWAGHNLNKCSRLCAEARPFGILIDRDDFPELPRNVRGLTAQLRRLRGIGDTPVWVSSEIASQFTPRERVRETPEVHVAGTCFSEDGSGSLKLLFARRDESRSLFPGKLEGCGGQLRYSENFVEGVQRHFRKELGLDVEVLSELHNFYEIREPNEPVIPGIRFLCRRVGTNEPTAVNHSEFLWLTEEEFSNMPREEFVGELKREVMALVERYREAREVTKTPRSR